MAVHYCDWTNGSDDDGDGSPLNPFKTIGKAGSSLNGGDEVRVAKDPTPRTDISVPLTWTHDSRYVTGEGDLTGEISQYDMIAKASAGGPGDWETVYEATTISYNAGTDVTTITLGTHNNHRYGGSTATVDSVIINGTPTASEDINVHGVKSGNNKSELMYVSGGWNLATEKRDGETWFVQRHATPSTKTGRAWVTVGGRYYHLSHVGFLRYDIGGLLSNNAWGYTISHCTFGATNGNGMYVNNSQFDVILNHCVFVCNDHGVLCGFEKCFNITFINCLTTGVNWGFELRDCAGILLVGNRFSRCNTAIKSSWSYQNVINSYGDTYISCGTQFAVDTGPQADFPRAIMHDYNGVAGDHRLLFETGYIMRDTTIYHSGNSSWKVTPTQYYNPLSTVANQDDILIAPCRENKRLKLSIYLRKNAAFNGVVKLAAYISGQEVVAPKTVTISANDTWEKHSITIPAKKVHETGPVASLRVYVKGNAGNIWVDTLEWR